MSGELRGEIVGLEARKLVEILGGASWEEETTTRLGLLRCAPPGAPAYKLAGGGVQAGSCAS